MPQGPLQIFVCPTCARRFGWHAALVGRKFTCDCGASFFPVPRDTPPPDADLDVASSASAPVRSAYPQAHRYEQELSDEPSPLVDFYLPIVLIALGVLLWFGQAAIAPMPNRGVGPSLAMAAITLVANIGIMMIGTLLAAKMLGVQFGDPRTMALKLAGAVAFAGSLAAILARLDGYDMRGLVAGWHLIILVYWLLFYHFFDMDLQESLLTVAIIALLQAGGMCILWKA